MATPELHLPTGWIRAGSAPERYDMGVAAPGSPAVIRSRADADPGRFGTLMQSFAADKYRGKRMRLRAELKTEAVDGAGTIWMRVDGAKRGLRFDNMEKRDRDGVLSGTRDWTERHVVLDVPADAESVHFGFYLRGTGRTSARSFEVAEVSDTVPVTSSRPPLADGPTNLDFSDIAGDD